MNMTLMKNPLMKALKTFFSKQSAIKTMLSDKKQLDIIINDIDSLRDLSIPTKSRIRNFMKILQVEIGGPHVPVSEHMNCDLNYVTKGALEVSFENSTIDAKGSQVGQTKIFCEIFY